MKTIWKYPLMVSGVQFIDLPVGAKILSVVNQREEIVIYALVNPQGTKSSKWAVVVTGTGDPTLDGAVIESHTFLGTVLVEGGALVWHVFVKELAS